MSSNDTVYPVCMPAWHANFCIQKVIWLLLQAAEQAQKLREARKEKADMEGNVNDMERAQDFLKAGNVKVGHSLPSPSPLPRLTPCSALFDASAKGRFGLTINVSWVVSMCLSVLKVLALM